jgi:hypothetical protein
MLIENLCFNPDKPLILKLSMRQSITNLSYAPGSGAATRSLPSEESEGLAQRKLALIIPTLNEAENLPPLLRHVRAVLDPL